MGKIITKRIYEPAEAADGKRILVDRLWPRGISKEKAKLDLWLKEIAPSTELRQWFHSEAGADKWSQFKSKYLTELKHNAAVAELRDIVNKNDVVTLLYSVHDEAHNHAQLIKMFIED